VEKRKAYVIIGIAAVVAVAGIISGSAIAAPTEVALKTIIEFSAEVPDNEVTMKKGESRTIPVDIYAPTDESLNVKFYVSEPEELGSVKGLFSDKTSKGVSVSTEKRDISLPSAFAENAKIAKRETVDMTVTIGPEAQTGEHTLALTLVDADNKGFVTRFFRVDVVE